MPNAISVHLDTHASLPERYNQDILVLLPRDPYCVFAYWEIGDSKVQAMEQKINTSWNQMAKAFRLQRYSHKQRLESSTLIKMEPTHEVMGNWYFAVDAPNRYYHVELGVLSAGEKFQIILSSNKVLTPHSAMSDIIDEKWQLLDWKARRLFWRIPRFISFYQDPPDQQIFPHSRIPLKKKHSIPPKENI